MPNRPPHFSGWEIPAELKANRFGVTHYHHPDILVMLNAQSPEAKLLSLVDEVLFADLLGAEPWQGRAIDLERKLLGVANENIQREVRKLLSSANCCGRYLGRLADKKDGRVVKHPGHAGIHNWTINPPLVSAESAGVSAPINETASAAHKLLNRIEAKRAKKKAELEPPQGGDLDMAA